jgi:hypothetical protein
VPDAAKQENIGKPQVQLCKKGGSKHRLKPTIIRFLQIQ